ncbi:MAG: protein kinase, partial [Lysobacteraceae bacterium]
ILSPALAQDTTATQRFLREARIAANLHHPNIVPIHDVAIHDGTPYMAMTYEPGGNVLPGAEGASDANAVLRIVRDNSDALDYAHRRGVVHRDIKPENILRQADGSCVLSDFGIARTIESTTALTGEGETIGTPYYMSPEHLRGEKVDGRSDLYSLGVVLYQLLSGKLPYVGTDGWAIGMQHLSAPIPRLPETFGRVQGLVDSLMVKDPTARLQTGAEVVRQIDGLLAGGTATPTMALSTAATTPRRRTQSLIGVVIALVVVGGIALSRLWHPHAAVPGLPTAAPADTTRSIAVLPFINMSGDPANEYFSDGLAETTLDMLAQVPNLKVISRTSSFAFKDKPQDMRKIGAALGAANLLEGSVQKAGNTVRITVQLIRAADGSHLWSHHYDRPMVDVFKIQDEIANQVVQQLAIALPALQQKRLTQKRTENVEAYQEYLKGLALLPERKIDGLRAAAAHFERAIALDPGYANAYVAASDVYGLLDGMGTISSQERERKIVYVDRALELAPDLGEAHTRRGDRLIDLGDMPGAEREYRRGIALAPSYARGYQLYGRFLRDYALRPEESIAMMRRAAALDPAAPVLRYAVILALTRAGHFPDAEAELAKLHNAYPGFAQGDVAEALLSATQGDLVRTLRAMERHEKDDPSAIGERRHRCKFLLRFGLLEPARRCSTDLAAIAVQSGSIQMSHAELLAWSGDVSGALAQIERTAAADSRLKPALLVRSGQPAEALAIFRRVAPEFFVDPVGVLYPGQAADAANIGIALLHTGAQEQGRILLQHALRAHATRPRIMDFDAGEWDEVWIHAALGEHEQAMAALKQGVADGYFLDLALLDNDPLLAGFRRDPRYQQILAPARAKAAAQVAAARAAGLL